MHSLWRRTKILGGYAQALLDILLPAHCRSCERRLTEHRFVAFCDICWGRIIPIQEPTCKRCGAPLQEEAFGRDAPLGCRECLALPAGAFERAVAGGLYEGVLKDAIHAYKLEGLDRLAKPLARLAVLALRASPRPCGARVVVAVPPSAHRLRERGFDPARRLARRVAEDMGWRFMARVLVRRRGSVRQSQLSRLERLQNPRGRFGAKRPEQVRGQKVLLVDDIYTTGATASECAMVLKQAGARSVEVLTVARGLRK